MHLGIVPTARGDFGPLLFWFSVMFALCGVSHPGHATKQISFSLWRGKYAKKLAWGKVRQKMALVENCGKNVNFVEI
jgi:hypothetical protein